MIFPGGATDEELAAVYRPRPWPPFTTYEVAGVPTEVWTTFTAEQIDIDVYHPAGWASEWPAGFKNSIANRRFWSPLAPEAQEGRFNLPAG